MITYKDLMVFEKLINGKEMRRVEFFRTWLHGSSGPLERRLFKLRHRGYITKETREGLVYYRITRRGLDKWLRTLEDGEDDDL